MSLVPKSDKNLEISTVSTVSVEKEKPKPKILEEDEYLEQLETIIQRDYYPDNEKLKAQIEYLEAVERNDVEKIRMLQMRYSSRRTDKPMNTPRTPKYFETPLTNNKNREDENDQGEKNDQPSTSQAHTPDPSEFEEPARDHVESESRKAVKLGVDQFLTKYTSEDNASFDEIMENTEMKHREKFAWMYKAEDEHKKKMEASLALPGADEQMLAIMDGRGPRAASVQNWSYQSKNAVMFVPDGVEWSPDEQERRMKMAERVIVHDNTRFTENPYSDDSAKRTMSKAAIIQSVVSKGKVDAQGDPLAFKHPMQQFSQLATPSPAPGVNESPMMTWGEIEGTPFRLDAGDLPITRTPGPTFKMPEIPLRDKLAQGLTEEISKRNRDKKQTAIKQVTSGLTTPKFGSVKSAERLASLSPAAQRLATSKLGIRIGTDKALRATYTPSPARSMGGDKTPLVSPSVRRLAGTTPSGLTPSESDPGSKRTADESLTDNLLQLRNKKPRAADFF